MDSNYFDTVVKMATEVIDTETGAPVALTHSARIKSDMSDQDIVKEIFIMLAQYVLHEFCETFRFEGTIPFNPHEGTRNDKSFQAIREMVEPIPPKPEVNVSVSYVQFEYTDTAKAAEMFNAFAPPKEEKPKKKHAFAKFFKEDWQDKRYKRGA